MQILFFFYIENLIFDNVYGTSSIRHRKIIFINELGGGGRVARLLKRF